MLSRRRFTIETASAPDQTRSRLTDAIGQPQTSLFERDSRPFVGTSTGDAFRIIRASRGRNSVRPVVQGTIHPSGTGSRVEGTMGIHPVVTIVLGLILLLPGWLVVTTFQASFATGRWDRTMLVVAAVMILFVVMIALGVIFERRRTLADLTAIIQGDRARS